MKVKLLNYSTNWTIRVCSGRKFQGAKPTYYQAYPEPLPWYNHSSRYHYIFYQQYFAIP